MSLLLETIRVEAGTPLHLGYHNRRMNQSRALLFGSSDEIKLEEVLRAIPSAFPAGTVKCRVLYSAGIVSVSFSAYQPKTITSLQLVNGDGLEYSHKFEGRGAIEKLMPTDAEADIIIVKNGLITDTSYANLAFKRADAWVTPAAPLLNGTCRARLLDDGVLTEDDIRPRNLHLYTHVRLINAMLPWHSAPTLPAALILGTTGG